MAISNEELSKKILKLAQIFNCRVFLDGRELNLGEAEETHMASIDYPLEAHTCESYPILFHFNGSTQNHANNFAAQFVPLLQELLEGSGYKTHTTSVDDLIDDCLLAPGVRFIKAQRRIDVAQISVFSAPTPNT